MSWTVKSIRWNPDRGFESINVVGLFVRPHNKPIEDKHTQADKEFLLVRIPNSQFVWADLILK